MSAPGPTILDVMAHPELLGPWFEPASSWAAWRAFLAALFGLPLDGEALDLYRRHTRREKRIAGQFREAWLVVGRRGGKSRIAATVAVYLANAGR
jgi:hypothetical protein